jgi:cytochrome c553
MFRTLLLLTVPFTLLSVAPAVPQTTPPRPAPRSTPPRLEAVAETRLLMEGLAQSNFRGVEKLLRQRGQDADDWTFIRGQALLLAETGNLLMLRPPKNPSQDAWMERATELRTAATRLARAAAAADYEQSRAGVNEVATSCNRCHQAFRVAVKVTPFVEPPERKVKHVAGAH